MRKRIIGGLVLLFVAFSLVIASQGWAFFNDFQMLTKEEIAQLSDQAVTEAYINTQIEILAQSKFFERAGMVPKDFEKYKELLRYRVILIQELEKRNLSIPKTEP